LIKVDPKPLEEPAMAQSFDAFQVTTGGCQSVVSRTKRDHPIMASFQPSHTGAESGAMMQFDRPRSADEAWHLRHAVHVAAFFCSGLLLQANISA
jgi:hypothetical protein